MSPWLIALAIVAGAFLILFPLWIFLIAPYTEKRQMHPLKVPYAHRGLWGGELPENSCGAFRAAVEAGFGIELDVQLSSDGEVMVFHDYTLDRVCGISGKIAEKTAFELSHIPLNGVEKEHIPTFGEVLALVDGRVPLLIELKGENGNTELVPKVLALLKQYKGPYCIESFNPLLLRAVWKQDPTVMRGILSTHLLKEKRKGSKILNFALSALWLNFLCRPNFLAWDQKYPKRKGLRVGLGWFEAASFVYTVHTQEDFDRHMAAGNCPIFDGFLPEKKS